MPSTSDNSDFSSSSVHSDSSSSFDDDSSLERDEYKSEKRGRLVALVTGYILIKINKRRIRG